MRVVAALGAGVCVLSALATAQEARTEPAPGAEVRPGAASTEMDGARHRVSQFIITYAQPNPDHPSEEEVLQATVTLGVTDQGFVAPREDVPTATFQLGAILDQNTPGFLFDSALPLIAPAVVRRLQDLGLIGVYVEPDPNEFVVEDGRIVDRRPARQRHMTLVVTTGVVTQVRTNGLGERFREEDAVDHPAHRRIAEYSPVQRRERSGPAAPADEAEAPVESRTDLVRRDLIDAYVHWLNRHPGRRVDVALAPTAAEMGGVTLDYLVTEHRPWLLYAQVSNTGTDETSEFRERFGFVHNQLTNNDDILTFEYLTANFEDVHALSASYERPLGDFDSRLRWRVAGSWYTYTASEVGLAGLDFDGEGWSVGGELSWNFLQVQDLFVDLVGGVRFERVKVDNDLAIDEGDEPFLLPYVGLRLQRVRESSQTFAGVTLEGNLAGVAGTDDDDIDLLGRPDVDDEWVSLRWYASHSFYLERLFADPGEVTATAHELALSAHGQFGFGSRLAPNFQDTVGGLYTVRGYPESVVAGDTTVVGTIEYRFHLPQGLAPRIEPSRVFGTPFRFAPQYVSGPTDWDLIFKAFLDIGHAESQDRLAFEGDHTLIGAGIGAELAFHRRLNVRVDWGFALNDLDGPGVEDEVDAGDSEVRFVVTLIF